MIGTSVAYRDDQHLPHPTIRHIKCSLILPSSRTVHRCSNCVKHRATMFSQLRRHITNSSFALSKSISSHINYRYLTSPEKMQRLHSLQNERRNLLKRLIRLKAKIEEEVVGNGVLLDEEITGDLYSVMIDAEKKKLHDYPDGSFKKVFWDQQKECASRADKRGMRWHPLMIKWCLYICHLSSKAYNTLRDSKCIQLPSHRTLQDYSHCIKTGVYMHACSTLPPVDINYNSWFDFI